jgi:hypothetical protein
MALQQWEHLDTLNHIPIWMVLSLYPETIFDPSSKKVTHLIGPLWPCNGGSISVPSLMSQIQMMLSADPDTIFNPSRKNVMKLTTQLWPCSSGRIWMLVLASQIWTVLSCDPETIFDPQSHETWSWWNNSPNTTLRCAVAWEMWCMCLSFWASLSCQCHINLSI